MKIALYEYVTGGGYPAAGGTPPSASLLAEGCAMALALASDFARLPTVTVWTTRDACLSEFHPPGCNVTVIDNSGEEEKWLARCAAADWTVLIAPETGGALTHRCQIVENAGGRLLSPSSAVVEIAANKQATAELLAAIGVRVPRGMLVRQRSDLKQWDGPLPAVIKPADGCGSQDIELLRSASDLQHIKIKGPLRVEEFVPGLAASCAVLCGPNGAWTLPPCEQRLSEGGKFTYLGGRLPLAADLARRASGLAAAAVAALLQPRGYLGVDMVLGDAADGSGDYVIEINPRLTTSYVGLRALATSNLAAAMLAVAEGCAPDLRFAAGPIEFRADGTIRS